MAEDRWNDGRQYGLPPIGLPQADLATPGSDTERRSFPGLATKSSVFAWVPASTMLYRVFPSAPTNFSIINLRKNTSPGGSSVDVPTWAAGAVISMKTYIDVIGVGITYHLFQVVSMIDSVSGQDCGVVSHNVINQVDITQMIVPFFDEPLIQFSGFNNLSSALGSQNVEIRLQGFVRNV